MRGCDQLRSLDGAPLVRYSMSMDGGVLGNVGVNTEEGSLYSKLLEEHDAVIITDAAVYDNPILLSSEPGAKQPVRVILARFVIFPDLNFCKSHITLLCHTW